MVYVDTGVLVPLFLDEPHSLATAAWYAREKRELVAVAWCIPEFASALGIKQQTFIAQRSWRSMPQAPCAMATLYIWRVPRQQA
jgi:predicted nucleic acid-binding protein